MFTLPVLGSGPSKHPEGADLRAGNPVICSLNFQPLLSNIVVPKLDQIKVCIYIISWSPFNLILVQVKDFEGLEIGLLFSSSSEHLSLRHISCVLRRGCLSNHVVLSWLK